MSSRSDIARGFGDYAFLTLDAEPRILRSKLKAGFPHIALKVPTASVEKSNFSLCRFNVAMTRFLRRDGKSGHSESATNGRYYGTKQIPIAQTDADKKALLKMHVPKGTMIEVLIHGDLSLPKDTTIICFDSADQKLAKRILEKVGTPWDVALEAAPGPYNRKAEYVASVTTFIETALSDPGWLGNSLEFDRV